VVPLVVPEEFKWFLRENKLVVPEKINKNKT
jgi:hypothetical protein